MMPDRKTMQFSRKFVHLIVLKNFDHESEKELNLPF